MREIVQRARAYLFARQQAYAAVFQKDNRAVDKVLKDLSKFCRANQTTFNRDPQIHALIEGRREVFLRITSHLDLTPEQLWRLYDGRSEE